MQAATRVPTTVARGMTRLASRMLDAGIVAHSRPRNAHRVSVAVVVTPLAKADGLDSVIAKWDGLKKNSPPIPTRISGRILSTVVATWTWPAERTPRRLTAVRSQSAPMASAAADAGFLTSAGM